MIAICWIRPDIFCFACIQTETYKSDHIIQSDIIKSRLIPSTYITQWAQKLRWIFFKSRIPYEFKNYLFYLDNILVIEKIIYLSR